jgi:NADH-quinone oxidoreductase subunit C
VTKAKTRSNGSRKQVLDEGVIAGDRWITVKREGLAETLRALQAEGYQSFLFMSAVDHLATPVVPGPPERFELIYQLRDMDSREELRVRVWVPEDDPVAPTASEIYAPAGWDERETWDLFGIRFDGHQDLVRILMPDDWEGHPLRRDYPVGGEVVDFSEDHKVWQTAPEQA